MKGKTEMVTDPVEQQTNEKRADNGEQALQAYMQRVGTDDECALSDLLADLMHWCHQRGVDWSYEVERAALHFDAEVTMEADGDA